MNLADGVQINEALTITVFCMILVVVALLAISFILDVFRVLSSRNRSQQKVEKVQQSSIKPLEKINAELEQDDEELIAVITASIASSLSRATSDIVVRNIVRVSQNTPVWARVGRQEQFNLK